MARLAYLGTPELAVPPLRALVGAGHHVVLCVTRPDRRRGRGGRTMPSPVKAAATELGVPVGHDIEDLASTDAELGVVVAFGRIIPARLLDVLPMVNVHFSLLPRWRGAAPLERAILAGDAETGVCLMKVEAGLDSGPVYAVRRVPLGEATLAELRDELVDVGTAMLVESLRGGVAGLPTPEPQRGEITIAREGQPRGPVPRLGATGRTAGTGGAAGTGLDHGGRGAGSPSSRLGRPRPPRDRSTRRARWTASPWRPGKASSCCAGYSPRAVRPCQRRNGGAARTWRRVSAWGGARHESGDRDADRRVEPRTVRAVPL